MNALRKGPFIFMKEPLSLGTNQNFIMVAIIAMGKVRPRHSLSSVPFIFTGSIFLEDKDK